MLLLLSGCASAGPRASRPVEEAAVKNVIFMVADGAGVGTWTSAWMASEQLATRRMPVAGLVDTRSAFARVTDSAAGATVYALGVRTFNGAIGVGPDCRAILRGDSVAARRDARSCDARESVFDRARRAGMALGVVTTTAVTDATPAAFATRSPRREWMDLIAEQYADAGLDVIMGGGRRYFEAATRPDRVDLLQRMCARAACPANAAELSSYRGERPLVGLFAAEGMDPAGVRAPSLPQMVSAALERLGRDPDGFFAVLESEGTDVTQHDNKPLAEVTAEILEFDRAVGVALDFAERTPGTLLIVTADHDTGGLALPARADSVVAAYVATGHTANLVPLFAFGPGAERFGGLRRNDEIGTLLMEMVGR